MKAKQWMFACLTLSVFSLSVKSSSAQVQWGIRAGGNMSAVLSKDEAGYEKVKLQPGFHIGGTADIAIANKFYIQPGLLFTTKGFKADQETISFGLSQGETLKFTPYYLELPLNLIYKPQLGSGNLLLGVGIYGAYGLGGRWKLESESEGLSVNGDLEFINDYTDSAGSNNNNRTIPYAKPLDFGANLLVGYEMTNQLYFQINGQLGLINTDHTINGVRNEKSSTKTVQFGLSIGYKF